MGERYDGGAMPPQKSRSGGFLKGVGCCAGGCVALVVVFIAILAGIYFYGRASISPYVEDFLALVEKSDYDAAYESVSSEWKARQSREEFEKFFVPVKEKLGPILSKTMVGVNIQSNMSGTTGVVTYSVTFEKGSGTIVFTMKKVEGEWRVMGARYVSPLLGGIDGTGPESDPGPERRSPPLPAAPTGAAQATS